MFFFFFQAEDGIRDLTVTGVQTCALPISFYCWNDGNPGPAGQRLPPNNWVSLFGGSAWQYVPAVNQFYYHMFYRQQPDLNWRNPQGERALFAAMRFLLDRGVAGFRLDAITPLFADAKMRDEPG